MVKPLVLMQEGEFREGPKRNWTCDLMGVVVTESSSMQKPAQDHRILGVPVGEELVLVSRELSSQLSCAGGAAGGEFTLHA